MAVEVFKVSPRTGFKAASSSSSHSPVGVLEDATELGEGFFSHFSLPKKCEGHLALGCESAPARQLIHAERSSKGSP